MNLVTQVYNARACRRIIDSRDPTSAARTSALKQAIEHANPGVLAKLL